MNSGDTAFMLISTAFVFFMTPGLAFFYGGLVRRKNVKSNSTDSRWSRRNRGKSDWTDKRNWDGAGVGGRIWVFCFVLF